MAETTRVGARGWRRSVSLAALAQLLSVMGFSCLYSFLPLYIQTLGVGSRSEAAVWAGVMLFASSFAVALCSPFWGAVADRHGAKLMVERAMFGGAVVIGATSLVTRVEALLVLFILQGCLTGINTAIATLVAGVAPRDRLGSALGACQTAVYVGSSVGPLLGGLLADSFSYRTSIRAGASLLLAAGLVVFLGVAERRRAEVAASRPPLLAGLRPALSSRPLLLILALIFIGQFASQAVSPVLPLFVQELVGTTDRLATLVGLALAVAGVAAALGAVALGRAADRAGHRRVLGWAMLGGALAAAPQAVVRSFAPLLVLRGVSGFFQGGLATNTSAAIGLLVPPERRGAAFGVSGSAFSLGNALGPLLGGLLAAAAGPRAVIGTSAAALGCGWLVVRALGSQQFGGESDRRGARAESPAGRGLE
ncbi:MAG TPA: MFS transporter [Vicinamibacteria bacterium]